MNIQNKALKMAIEALSQDEGWFEPEAAIKTCKEALEQPAQEPYGWIYEERIDDPEHPDGYYYSWGFSWIEIGSGKPVYTHPAPSWQGLSDYETQEIIDNLNNPFAMIRVAEIQLKEKNHG